MPPKYLQVNSIKEKYMKKTWGSTKEKAVYYDN